MRPDLSDLTKLLKSNGAKRIRTADPLNAIEMRYQLRYSPAYAFTMMP